MGFLLLDLKIDFNFFSDVNRVIFDKENSLKQKFKHKWNICRVVIGNQWINNNNNK